MLGAAFWLWVGLVPDSFAQVPVNEVGVPEESRPPGDGRTPYTAVAQLPRVKADIVELVVRECPVELDAILNMRSTPWIRRSTPCGARWHVVPAGGIARPGQRPRGVRRGWTTGSLHPRQSR